MNNNKINYRNDDRSLLFSALVMVIVFLLLIAGLIFEARPLYRPVRHHSNSDIDHTQMYQQPYTINSDFSHNSQYIKTIPNNTYLYPIDKMPKILSTPIAYENKRSTVTFTIKKNMLCSIFYSGAITCMAKQTSQNLANCVNIHYSVPLNDTASMYDTQQSTQDIVSYQKCLSTLLGIDTARKAITLALNHKILFHTGLCAYLSETDKNMIVCENTLHGFSLEEKNNSSEKFELW